MRRYDSHHNKKFSIFVVILFLCATAVSDKIYRVDRLVHQINGETVVQRKLFGVTISRRTAWKSEVLDRVQGGNDELFRTVSSSKGWFFKHTLSSSQDWPEGALRHLDADQLRQLAAELKGKQPEDARVALIKFIEDQ